MTYRMIQPISLKRFLLYFSLSALVLLFGCTSPDLSSIDAELNAAVLVTPAAPAVPTEALAQILNEVEESGEDDDSEPAAESESAAYPEPAIEEADSAYPAVEAEAVAEVAVEADAVTETVAEPAPETVADDADPVDENVAEVGHVVVVPAAERSSGESVDIEWIDLIPVDYSVDAIFAKYQDELSKYEPDTPEAMELRTQMEEEFNNAPTNEALNGKLIRMPGFITPLEYADEKVVEFLLVPYFGACIHVPAPPVNQTVLVKTGEGGGISLEDTFSPIWVTGILQTESTSTILATAGYTISNATVEFYSDQQ